MVKVHLPKGNLALLPADLLQKYNADVAALAARYGATLVEPANSVKFAISDFEDNAHLNADGGDKFFRAIEPAVSATIK